MKLTMGVAQGQVMTASMRQAIKLVGLSSMELAEEVRMAIEQNPMLEFADELADDEALYADEGDPRDEDADAEPDDLLESFDDADQAVALGDGDVLATDALSDSIVEGLIDEGSWDAESPSSVPVPTPRASSMPEDAVDIGERRAPPSTLSDHIHWQLNLTPMSDRDRFIAHAIIDGLNEDGLLTVALDELLPDEPLPESMATDAAPISTKEIEVVLKRIQHFDPVGVAARDIAECIRLQLESLPPHTPLRAKAIDLVRDHFNLLVARDYPKIKRAVGLTEDGLASVLELVRDTNPRPASSIGSDDVEIIVPDLIVRGSPGRWTVEVVDDHIPKARIHPGYACLVRRGDQSPDNQFLREHLQNAHHFLKNLGYRNDTLLRVGQSIVRAQAEFLEHGEEHMKPLTLADIATVIGLHESTVSRATTRKYMSTPRGTYELKYFFSSHVDTATGDKVSSTAIRSLIKKLTDEEDPAKPLSDSKIAALLTERDITVARRTVAKYRESLSIPPSNERKRLA